jgi:hypothetical protein
MPSVIQALDGAMRTTVTLDDELLARAEQLRLNPGLQLPGGGRWRPPGDRGG